MIVGEFTFDQILSDTPRAVWDRTHTQSGISEIFLCSISATEKPGMRFKLRNIGKTPVQPNEVFEHFVAPQSYRYVEMRNERNFS